MATVVHYHYYRGVAQLPKLVNRQFASDSVVALHEPPVGGGTNTITGSQTTLPAAPAGTQLVRVQVADGGKLRYQVINESNPDAVADGSSPSITGEQILHFNQGWQLSLIEAS